MREPAYTFDEVMRVSVWRPRDFPEASTEAAWKKLRGHINEQIAAHCVDDADSASRTNAQSQMAEWEARYGADRADTPPLAPLGSDGSTRSGLGEEGGLAVATGLDAVRPLRRERASERVSLCALESAREHE